MSEGRKPRGTFGAVGKSVNKAANKTSRVSIPADEMEDGAKPFAGRQSGSGAITKVELSASADKPGSQLSGDSGSEGVYRVLPARMIRSWKFKDRRPEELDKDESYAELISSARVHGIIEPILVRETPAGSDVPFEEIAGFKRLSAGKVLDISVPVIIRNMSDREATLIQKAENKGRSAPSAWSIAQHYLTLLEAGVYESQTQLADAHDINKGTLSNLLRVVRKMPEDLVKSIDMYALSGPSLIRLISAIDNFTGSPEVIVDRLVEYADEINAKPEKTISIVDRAVASLVAGSAEPAPSKAVYQSAKGKTLTVQTKPSGIQLTIHPSVVDLISADELTEMVTRHLADKGLTTERKG